MKDEIRKQNKALRRAMTEQQVSAKSHAAATAFVASDIYAGCGRLMLYMPLKNETDTSEIAKSAFGDGKKIIYPVTDEVSGEITPFYADENTEFAKGAFSVSEPRQTDEATPREIDVIVVPGIAFDRAGRRVGFGKGCYDRFLAQTDGVKVGLCYDFQICDEIPPEAHDVSMDYLLTESGLIKCEL